ncbi:lysozyme inhibitor LprI family protein [Methylovulum psychrotolerans]|uniref:Lysozyme inhibitor LprI-like N-terminal domain-containing protein n=1 Tax=Methylovulum psychrotolerans TaxID=1704499 RepID=A0A2S5CPC0_9GAMM|nr:lysozyme inhibitor LprI family protein [Methylovulum psychrotolerans]POZ52607.1 hypothetical protein AADEFJLK_01211 [Methylovulum psychrotolerans]
MRINPKAPIPIAIFLALTLTAPALAQDCANAQSTVDIMECQEARYQAADKALNAVYSKAMKTLSDTEKKKLKEAQRAWLKYRDASLDFIIEINKDGGSYANIVIGDYKAKIVEKRVLELKYLLSSPDDSPVEW